jgi:hypothetical protein
VHLATRVTNDLLGFGFEAEAISESAFAFRKLDILSQDTRSHLAALQTVSRENASITAGNFGVSRAIKGRVKMERSQQTVSF